MANRSGGVRHEADGDNDVYFHRWNAEELISYLRPHYLKQLDRERCRVLDACAGEGVLGKVFARKYPQAAVVYQDIKTSGESILDFEDDEGFDIIICNPPWIPVELPEAIYHKLDDDLLNPGGVLFFVINNTFCYQGPERALALDFQKFYFLPRYAFATSGKALLDCGVMVHHYMDTMLDQAAELRPFIPLSRVKGDEMEELL